MTAQVNPLDPRVKRTRRLLQQAFIDLVHEKSFEAITVQDITERATLNRATFYTHFTDKHALLDATIGASFTEFLQQRVPVDAELHADTLRRLVVAVCDYHRDLSSQCKRAAQSLESLLEPRIVTHLQETILTALSRTRGTANCRPEQLELAATTLSWAIYGVVQRWNNTGRIQQPAVLANAVLPLLLGSVGVLAA